MTSNPLYSLVCLIYRSPLFADAVYESLHRHTPALHDGSADFTFIANNATPELLEHLVRKGYPYRECRSAVRTESELVEMGIAKPIYLHNTYIGWNFAIEAAISNSIILLSSDMMFSTGWMESLTREMSPDRIATSQLVETTAGWRMAIFPGSLNFNCGDTPGEFEEDKFLSFARDVVGDGSGNVSPGTSYGPMGLDREAVRDAGMFPLGNLHGGSFDKIAECGDTNLIRKMKEQGAEHVTVLDSVVYHFGEGEMRL